MGIKVFTSSKGDDLFIGVKLPAGWKKLATDHNMWSKLVDDEGRERASIFYKAAFYDRNAHINFNTFISMEVGRVGFVIHKDFSNYEGSYETPLIGIVKDITGEILFKTDVIDCPSPMLKDSGGSFKEEDIIEKQLKSLCREYLEANWPDYESIYAYW